MIICENRNAYAYDVSFIKPHGKLVDFMDGSTAWDTTTIKTLSEIQRFLSSDKKLDFFDDTLGNKYNEYVDIIVVMSKNLETNRHVFTMFMANDIESVFEYVSEISEDILLFEDNVLRAKVTT